MPYNNHQFSDSFCADITTKCLEAIAHKDSFNLVAVTGVGVTFFVRHLERKAEAEFVHINPYEMHDFNANAVYTQLATRLGTEVSQKSDSDLLPAIARVLQKRAKEAKTVVLLFNRFDRLRSHLDERFFESIRHLRDIDRSKIVIVFVTSEPIAEVASNDVATVLSLVPKTLYFPGYNDEDMQAIVEASGGRRATEKELHLAGGHHLLLQVLQGCQDLDNALSDPIVELLVADIVSGLSSKRRQLVQRLAGNASLVIEDAYLLGTHFICRTTSKTYRLFSELLGEYIQRSGSLHLPLKEKRLFELLKKRTGEVVSKEAIFDHVWQEDNGIATDWSLNALVYRLRRHAAFDKRRYSIESHKKEGYRLVDHLSDT